MQDGFKRTLVRNPNIHQSRNDTFNSCRDNLTGNIRLQTSRGDCNGTTAAEVINLVTDGVRDTNLGGIFTKSLNHHTSKRMLIAILELPKVEVCDLGLSDFESVEHNIFLGCYWVMNVIVMEDSECQESITGSSQ